MGHGKPLNTQKPGDATRPDPLDSIPIRNPHQIPPPNKSYKMLGVHINTILDFKGHLAHITKDVKLLDNALAKRKLSPPYKTLVI